LLDKIALGKERQNGGIKKASRPRGTLKAGESLTKENDVVKLIKQKKEVGATEELTLSN